MEIDGTLRLQTIDLFRTSRRNYGYYTHISRIMLQKRVQLQLIRTPPTKAVGFLFSSPFCRNRFYTNRTGGSNDVILKKKGNHRSMFSWNPLLKRLQKSLTQCFGNTPTITRLMSICHMHDRYVMTNNYA